MPEKQNCFGWKSKIIDILDIPQNKCLTAFIMGRIKYDHIYFGKENLSSHLRNYNFLNHSFFYSPFSSKMLTFPFFTSCFWNGYPKDSIHSKWFSCLQWHQKIMMLILFYFLLWRICYHFNIFLSLALISQNTQGGFGGFVCLVFFGFSVCQQTIHSLTLLLKIKINSNSI